MQSTKIHLVCVMLILAFFSISWAMPESSIRFGLLKYNGGGDWYANPTSLPNLIKFCNKELGMDIGEEPITVEAGSTEIFGIPFIHMTGHGNVVFSDLEAENLRTYLLAGGFLHIDDNYGMDKFVRPAIKKIFPGEELVEIPFNHPIYHQEYDFANGIPKIHEHDNNSPRAFGIIKDGRLLLLYTYETDLGDGWENPEVHNDPIEKHIMALKMGANIIRYIFSTGD